MFSWPHQFTFPPTVQEGSHLSTPSPALVSCRLFNDGHSEWYEVVPHCCFDLHFSNNLVTVSIFPCAYWPSVCPLWRNVYLGLLPIFQLGCFLFVLGVLLNYRSCLYILEIQPLSAASFADIFSQSVGCLFIFYMVFFALQNFLSLIRSHLFIFAFIPVALSDLRKHWFYLCFHLGVTYGLIFMSLSILTLFLCMA